MVGGDGSDRCQECMNGKARRLLFRPCETAAIYRIWKRADCGKKTKPSPSAGRYWEMGDFGGTTGSTNNAALQKLFLFKPLRRTRLHYLLFTVFTKARVFFLLHMQYFFSHFLLLFIMSCRKPIVKHIR